MAAEISAQLVRELRDRTGAGMMDCKRALQETNGDIEAAVRVLREKGMASAAKRADRATPEPLEEASPARAVEAEPVPEPDAVAVPVSDTPSAEEST